MTMTTLAGGTLCFALSLALGMTASGVVKATDAKQPSQQCSTAKKALAKAEQSLGKTEGQLARTRAMRESCGSKPMCDGYDNELRMLVRQKPKLESTVTQRKVGAAKACTGQ